MNNVLLLAIVDQAFIKSKLEFHKELSLVQYFSFTSITFRMDVCCDIDVQMYADDTVVHVSGKDSSTVSEKLNSSLKNISTWLEDSCLTL